MFCQRYKVILSFSERAYIGAGRGNQREKVGSESGENTIDLFYLIFLKMSHGNPFTTFIP
jgi:hypothetical protein